MDSPLRQTLFDAASFLQSHEVSYALIGGLAVSLRGQPRLTADVDLVVASTVEQALQLLQVLDQTPFRPLFKDVGDVVTTAFLLPLQHRVTKVKVDIAIGMTGFEREVISRAELLSIGGCLIPVASAEDLVIMKVLAGRPQDDQDLNSLVIVQGEKMDWNYCLQMSRNLGEAIGQDLEARVVALRDSQGMG